MTEQEKLLRKKLNALRLEVAACIVDNILETVNEIFPAKPPLKQLTDLADSPEDCRKVWECVTGETPWGEIKHEQDSDWSTSITLDKTEIAIWNDGEVFYEIAGRPTYYNPFHLVALLTELGYGITKTEL